MSAACAFLINNKARSMSPHREDCSRNAILHKCAYRIDTQPWAGRKLYQFIKIISRGDAGVQLC